MRFSLGTALQEAGSLPRDGSVNDKLKPLNIE
jgi:hypothetical protein